MSDLLNKQHNIKDFTLDELEQLVMSLGMPKYRAAQTFDWMHPKGAASFEEMSNIPKEIRQKLGDLFSPGGLNLLRKKVSLNGEAVKLLFELYDGQAVESVLMKYSYGYAACISTQVGCRMGCSFCASALDGWERNLTPGELIDQLIVMQKFARKRIGHVVLMGTGEPLDNFAAVTKFLSLVSAPYGLNISQRRITLSTCGIVPRISELMKLRLGITLAVSLHAPNDALRSQLMPVNNVYPLSVLLPVCREYAKETGRRITFEYALFKGVNDASSQAVELAEILRGIHCHINLIPANPVAEKKLSGSQGTQVKLFQEILEKAGYPVTLRRSLGLDIDGACGQLRAKAKGNEQREIK